MARSFGKGTNNEGRFHASQFPGLLVQFDVVHTHVRELPGRK
jgi:hypothetical protein